VSGVIINWTDHYACTVQVRWVTAHVPLVVCRFDAPRAIWETTTAAAAGLVRTWVSYYRMRLYSPRHVGLSRICMHGPPPIRSDAAVQSTPCRVCSTHANPSQGHRRPVMAIYIRRHASIAFFSHRTRTVVVDPAGGGYDLLLCTVCSTS
jgi:hypothetical protein